MENKIGRIISVNKTNWNLIYNNEIYVGIINNSYQSETYPVVGDYVVIDIDDYLNCIIKSIYERKNYISKLSVDKSQEKYRKGKEQILASNIDIVFIVTSLNNDFNIARLERMVLVGLNGKTKIAFILTKSDLCSYEEKEKYKNMILKRFNYPVFIVSSYLNEGIEEIKSIWKVNETAVFIGSSGVGKSTLINHLIGEDKIKTKSIRYKDDRGRHTTTSRNLYILKDNRVVIDEPGIRSVALNDDYDLNQIFSKISELETECKYTACTHENSNGCAVIEAINNGIITLEELNRYKKLKLKDNRDNKRKIQKDKINYYKQTKRNHLK